MFNDFYEYRTEVRKKLGRSQLYPEKSNIYKVELISIFQQNRVLTETYFNNLTLNEKQALQTLFGDIDRIKYL
ncbi:hypothetical protein [Lacrimispora algidixylanolytica]|jgi:hypothetical protein|uniref:Uncharacterized protein n=1 Tax=Lacrimispora algidixylanolytica TaxID=94868 RepID=A0A419SYU0_9FIRM|nr:hypothetical protein [Lacrimispora algidixylanolytica]RKD30375.1 hypothetical protein BET01_07235 [Lacrimispora algidixylanolytica]